MLMENREIAMAVHMHTQLAALRPRGGGRELELASLSSKDPLDAFQVRKKIEFLSCTGKYF